MSGGGHPGQEWGLGLLGAAGVKVLVWMAGQMSSALMGHGCSHISLVPIPADELCHLELMTTTFLGFGVFISEAGTIT